MRSPRIIALATLLVCVSGCPERWDAAHPPGVSGSYASAGSDDAETSGAGDDRDDRDDEADAPLAIAAGEQRHPGELTDGDHVLEVDGTLYDELSFSTVEGASIVITMRSTAFVPYLHLLGPDGHQLAHGGTPPGETTDVAEFVVVAPTTGEYRIYANALEPHMRGRYDLRLVVEPPPRPSTAPPP